ncbi:hypothetical protein [Roseobacter denitrificans]|uniref:hypothetical protein n=1 Tax=Roseobacter denitrificans TaxID=2434 RepID=UPI00067FA68E|nr:hypothetical protein [Roseobacter denitrificans]
MFKERGRRQRSSTATLFRPRQRRHVRAALVNILECNAHATIPAHYGFDTAGSVWEVVGPDKLLAEFANTVNIGQHAGRVLRHRRAGVVCVGAGSMSDSHDLLARAAKVLKAVFYVYQLADNHGVKCRQGSTPLSFSTSHDVEVLKGK